MSKSFKKVAYDHATNTMEITYNNGSTYSYHGVSTRTWDEFNNAKSRGKYLQDHIKKDHRVEAKK